ncbi:TylF/MycF/NovP-related O-methyltransferase [Photorhabdus africana]|uniref:TylF/MycF/NovP-related O-methyltransferase n=1 Tax=Photorhabdus africana TaxID=3097554 RepID=UPI002B40D4E1|nr:TylF/MycF/NovP-related O-methyltransferase [Photorhabdus sp. CRI-LC]
MFREGDFAGSLQEVKNNIIKYGNISSCTFIKGWFEISLANWSRPIAAIYLDVDLQKSTRDCLKYLYPWLTPGGSLYSQDGHLPLVLDVFEDVNFWLNEIGTLPPIVVGIRKKKLIKITKPDTPSLPLL